MKSSVIIPCLNAADTVGETQNALALHAWPVPWEFIIADNGSTDALGSAVAPYKSKVPSLQIIDASERRGAAYARNVAVHASRGEGILYCDADDIPAEGWAAAIVAALSQLHSAKTKAYLEQPTSAACLPYRTPVLNLC